MINIIVTKGSQNCVVKKCGQIRESRLVVGMCPCTGFSVLLGMFASPWEAGDRSKHVSVSWICGCKVGKAFAQFCSAWSKPLEPKLIKLEGVRRLPTTRNGHSLGSSEWDWVAVRQECHTGQPYSNITWPLLLQCSTSECCGTLIALILLMAQVVRHTMLRIGRIIAFCQNTKPAKKEGNLQG